MQQYAIEINNINFKTHTNQSSYNNKKKNNNNSNNFGGKKNKKDNNGQWKRDKNGKMHPNQTFKPAPMDLNNTRQQYPHNKPKKGPKSNTPLYWN
ncbi:hypothetical protein AOL_s00010g1, partial [Orbilia oligospora ATCC 24927]